MTPIESLYEIEAACAHLQKYLRSKDMIVLRKARRKYESLVDRFFKEQSNMIQEEDRQRCMADAEYFMILINRALENYYTA